MTDQHILNTIAMLQRKAATMTDDLTDFSYYDSSSWELQEDWGALWLANMPEYEALCYEAQQRGLRV